ncbi:MAG: translation initiation factor IF-2 associated domain-containing protein, partial [Methylococcaceae bacterium]|nr:translation initiation factor IF-2 associated domain-containing protein [Methylococcaceae bacterium]
MSDQTVRQLAEVVRIPLERLLEQLKEAGLSANTPDDVISEDEKMQLLAHLRKRHGKDEGESKTAPRRVTLERRKVIEMKQASVPGSATKTISVEVRKKKTYINKRELAETAEPKTVARPQPAHEERPALKTVEPAIVLEQKERPAEEVMVTEPVAEALQTVEAKKAPAAESVVELQEEYEEEIVPA